MPSRNAFEKKAPSIAIAISFVGTSVGARADTLEDLQRQIETLQQKVLELDQKQRTTEQKQADITVETRCIASLQTQLPNPFSHTNRVPNGGVGQ
jgi:predicted RNase H-like nuclease (RuvC/YqgF family)